MNTTSSSIFFLMYHLNSSVYLGGVGAGGKDGDWLYSLLHNFNIFTSTIKWPAQSLAPGQHHEPLTHLSGDLTSSSCPFSGSPLTEAKESTFQQNVIKQRIHLTGESFSIILQHWWGKTAPQS